MIRRSTIHAGIELLVLLTGLLGLAFGGCDSRPPGESSRPAGSVSSKADDSPVTAKVPVASRAASLTQIQNLLRRNDVDAAELALQGHLIRHPDDPQAQLLVAQILAFRGRIDQAIANTESLLRDQPESHEARALLVDWLNQRGFRFQANEHVRWLSDRQGATTEQLRGLIAPSRSFAGLKEKPSLDDHELIEKLGPLNVARALFSEGDVNDAYEVLSKSELVRQQDPEALAFFGQLLLDSQRFDRYQDWHAQAESRCQDFPAYWMSRGAWASHQRDHLEAVRCFAEAILREPGDLLAHDRIAQSLDAAGLTDESERFRQRGIEIDRLLQQTAVLLSDREGGLKAMAEISRLLGQIGRPVESLEWLRLALERMGSPSDAMTQYRTALTQLRDADFQACTRATLLCELDLKQFPLKDLRAPTDNTTPTEEMTTSPSTQRSGVQAIPPSFVNVAGQVGIKFTYRNAEAPVTRELLMFQQIGAGVACFDYDWDGRVDFYIGQGASDPPTGRGSMPNLLTRNLGDRFVDVTSIASCDDRNYTTGITAGDWNQDGFLDLVVANLQHNRLLINQGDGTFRQHEGDSVWNQPMYTASVAMADVTADHLPDLVEVNYFDDAKIFDPVQHHPDGTPVRLPAPLHFQPAVDRVFVSIGDGSMGGRVLGDPEQPLASTGLGVLITDLDGKGANEIFVANDHRANHLWEQVAGSPLRWNNTGALRGVAYGARGMALGSMGIAAADFDQNGRLDLHVTNFENQWSNQFMQNGEGYFEDLVVAYGLAEPTYEMVGFGTQAIDYDNNTTTDLVIGNGHIDELAAMGTTPFAMPTQLFSHDGTAFRQLEVLGDDAYWKSGHLTRAVARCDWNCDGRMDVVATDLNQPFVLLENRTPTPWHWLQLRLVGAASERDAIGTTIVAHFGGQTVTTVVQAGDGYMCKNESIVSFGLAENTQLDRLEVRWPAGQVQVLTQLAADRRWLIVEGHDQPFALTCQ